MRLFYGVLIYWLLLPVYAVSVCQLDLQDDWQVNANQVVIDGQHGHWQISPNGQLELAGKIQQLTAAQQQLAQQYQANLRQQLPWIDQQADQALNQAYQALNQVVEQQFGKDNTLNQRLVTIRDQFAQLKGSILEKTAQGYLFHHQALADIEQRSQQLANQALGGLLQASINALGKSVTEKNGLQNLLGGLGSLQQQIQQQWQNQQQQWQQKGDEVCERVGQLEQQRQRLFKQIPHEAIN